MTKIIEDVKLDFSDVLIMPKRSTLDSRSKVDITRTFRFKHSPVEYTGCPILVANMDVTGTIAMAKALTPYNMGVALHKFYDVETLYNYFISADRNPHTFYTVGIANEDYLKFRVVQQKLNEYSPQAKLKYVCIDVANGYSRKFVNFVEKVRNENPELVILAGNVVTGDMVYDLLERGADIVKVGIGPGSVCTTRKMTGIGYPQLSAILECQDAAHGTGGLICGDGGITCPGDLAKAFAGGADFVMAGGIFAGHQECEGVATNVWYKLKPELNFKIPQFVGADITLDVTNSKTNEIHTVNSSQWCNLLNHAQSRDKVVPFLYYEKYSWALDLDTSFKPTMRFYGMSSQNAMDKHYGGKAKYRAPEGKAVEVPFKGPVDTTIEELLGGLRSACTYAGARRLKDLPKCTTFIKVNRQLNNIFGA